MTTNKLIMSIPVTPQGAMINRRHYDDRFYLGAGYSGTYINQANGFTCSDFELHWLIEKDLEIPENEDFIPPSDFGQDCLTLKSEIVKTIDIYCDSVSFDDSGIAYMTPEERSVLLQKRDLSGNGTQQNPYRNLCWALAKAECLTHQYYDNCQTVCIPYVRIIVSGIVDYYIRTYPEDIAYYQNSDVTFLFDELDIRADGKIIIDGSGGAEFIWQREFFSWETPEKAMIKGSGLIIYNTDFQFWQWDVSWGKLVEEYDNTGSAIVTMYNCKVKTEGYACVPLSLNYGAASGRIVNCNFQSSSATVTGEISVIANRIYNCTHTIIKSGISSTCRGFSGGKISNSTVSMRISGELANRYDDYIGIYTQIACNNIITVEILNHSGKMFAVYGVYAGYSSALSNNNKINIIAKNIHADCYGEFRGLYDVMFAIKDNITIDCASSGYVDVDGIDNDTYYPHRPCITGANVNIKVNANSSVSGIKGKLCHGCTVEITANGTVDVGYGFYSETANNCKLNMDVAFSLSEWNSPEIDIDGYKYLSFGNNNTADISLTGSDVRGSVIFGFSCERSYEKQALIQNCSANISGSGKCYRRGCSFIESDFSSTASPVVFINCTGNSYCWESDDSDDCFPSGRRQCKDWECAL